MALYLLILNVVTPIFAYAFTDLTLSQTGYEGQTDYLDEDKLRKAEVFIDADERYVLTWGGTPITFVNSSQELRIDWKNYAVGPEQFRFYTRWWPDVNPYWNEWTIDRQAVWINGVYHDPNGDVKIPITNQTILNAWDIEYNWTRISQRTLGMEIFVTCEGYNNSIVSAMAAGELNMTVGDIVETAASGVSPVGFIKFYSGLVTGENLYDLPEAVAWIFRLEALIFMFTLVVIGRDMLPLP